jgi:hypothetical protein
MGVFSTNDAETTGQPCAIKRKTIYK